MFHSVSLSYFSPWESNLRFCHWHWYSPKSKNQHMISTSRGKFSSKRRSPHYFTFSSSFSPFPSFAQVFVSPHTCAHTIDKLYTRIGNVFRLHLRVEPFAVLFWALGIVQYSAHILNRWPSLPAWHPSTVVLAQFCTAGVSYCKFNLSEDESATCLFRSCRMKITVHTRT